MVLLSRSEEIVLLAVWKLSAEGGSASSGKDNAYGVTIRDLVSRDTRHEWTFGAIYKPLKKLTYKQYVRKTGSSPCSVRGGRSKFLYSLTPEGKEALREIRKIHKTVWNTETKLAFD